MKSSREADGLRIGYITGQAKRLNERVIDNQWVGYLAKHAELVPIPPLQLFRMFGGTIERFRRSFPHSLERLSSGISELRDRYGIRTLYMNVPSLLPYLMMGRAQAGADLGFLGIAHCAGSESWMRQWLGIAPFLSERDVLLCSSEASLTALRRISDRYRTMSLIPLCTALRDRDEAERAIAGRNGTRLLSIGRLEDVKNIDSLLRIFAKLKKELPQAILTIAGEYTGMRPGQAELYKERLLEIVRSLELEASVRFAGPVDGEEKERLFRAADLLVNLSTDPGETFGYNLIEAKVWGVPVLCANWNGFREVVSHGEDGLLIDCEWPDDGGLPRLREDQAAEWAVRLLRDERLRAAMSGCAAERAGLYDYETVFPRISAAIARAESSKASTHRAQTGEWMLGTLSELPDAYHVDSLRRLPFFEEPLIDIVSGASTLPLREWMPAIRPIIGHYAGRFSYAEL